MRKYKCGDYLRLSKEDDLKKRWKFFYRKSKNDYRIIL